jgi:hypothetical protein
MTDAAQLSLKEKNDHFLKWAKPTATTITKTALKQGNLQALQARFNYD